ncbi:unnamed protein product, partial [marine sediment metagenome]
TDKQTRKKAKRQTDLFTPLVKAYCSDFSYALTREAIQVLGGAGYCSEFPAEQYARDCKIASIWEGTTYIQSLDLVGRKLMMEGGLVIREWIEDVMAFAERHRDNQDLGLDFKLLHKSAKVIGDVALNYTIYIKEGKLGLIALGATRFLECCSEVFLAQMILEQGLIAQKKSKNFSADSADGIFYQGKLETARYFCRNMLPNVFARQVVLQQEDTSALDIPEGAF